MNLAGFRNNLVFKGILLVFGILHLFIVILDHYYYRTVTLDYAVYNFAFYDFAHLHVSPVPCYIFPFPATFLQDHFSFTLPLLAPLYWVLAPLAGTYSLLIIQWAFILCGAVATYKCIEKLSGNKWLAPASLLYYFLLFGRYSSYRADVNLAIIGSAMIPVFLYYFLDGKTIQMLLVFIFLLFNREDYALWLIFICIFLAVYSRKNKQQRNRALIFMLLSLGFFILLLTVLIPAFENENKKYALFDFTAVGETPVKAFVFIITHPFEALRLLFVNQNGESYYNGIKTDFYLVYLFSGGTLLFLRPYFFIPFVPILLKKMYDDNPLRWSTETYYSVEFVSIMPLLIFIVLASFSNHNVSKVVSVCVCFFAAAITCYKMLVPPQNPIVGESFKYNVISSGFYKPDVNVEQVKNCLSQIPGDAAVTATGRLLPHLAFRKKAYYFPNLSDSEYAVLLKANDTYPLSQEDFDIKVAELKADSCWVIQKEFQDVILFKRKILLAPAAAN